MMIDWEKISLENLAGLISSELRKHDIDSVLVGGACVTIYAPNRYQSYDLDFITHADRRKVREALAGLGFYEKGKYFEHTGCLWLVEFVSPPVAIGKEPVQKFHDHKTQLGTVRLLRPEDSIKDRLASYFHWRDKEGLKQAVSIALVQKVNLGEVKNWATQEGFSDRYQDFVDLLERERHSQ